MLASIKTHKLPDGSNYYALNPLGYVPLLELDDGTRLREGPAIVQYIADLVPVKNLAPANGTLPRYRLQEWLSFIGTELHRSFSPLFNPTADPAVKQFTLNNLAKKFEWLNKQLAGKKYLTGDTFTIADSYLFVILNWTNGLNIDLSKYPAIKDFQARVAARPKVHEAMEAEGLLKKAA